MLLSSASKRSERFWETIRTNRDLSGPFYKFGYRFIANVVEDTVPPDVSASSLETGGTGTLSFDGTATVPQVMAAEAEVQARGEGAVSRPQVRWKPWLWKPKPTPAQRGF